MTPIWKRRKSDVTDEELNDFYKQKYFDASDPIATIFINVEGAVNYTALVYIPKKPPYDLYSEHYEKGLQLYSKAYSSWRNAKNSFRTTCGLSKDS